MIGVYDSGHGGLTIFLQLQRAFPHAQFIYLGDHASAPYGNKDNPEVLRLTKAGTAKLFEMGCNLVVLACNTATAVAMRKMQQTWLPKYYKGQTKNILGIIAPTVEAATQTPWSAKEPQYPQKYNTDTIAVFGTTQTINSGVYVEEIKKRCPKVEVVQQVCPSLAGAIEAGAPKAEIEALVHDYVREMMVKVNGIAPDWGLLGCTHYPLIKDIFETYLPPTTRLLAQPDIIVNSLSDYLERHPEYITQKTDAAAPNLLFTSGNAAAVSASASQFLGQAVVFEAI